MKLQIDTEAKTIKLEGNVNTEKLFRFLKGTFPKTWGDFEICPEVINNTTWINPIYVPYTPIHHWRPYWAYFPNNTVNVLTSTTGLGAHTASSDNHNSINYSVSAGNVELKPGTYNIQVEL